MIPLIGLTCGTGVGTGSFHTTHQTNDSYVQWVARAGGLPILLPNTDPALVDRALEPLAGLLLTGGRDVAPLLYGAEPDPHLGEVDVLRDRFELPLAQAALGRGLPVFGICRGIQMLNVALGGTLRQALDYDPIAAVQHSMKPIGGTTVHHTLVVEPESKLHGVLGAARVAVNSYHHQAVDEPGEGLAACAHALDGTIEAVEGTGNAFVLGVQWHPEVLPDDPNTAALFRAFIEACRQGR